MPKASQLASDPTVEIAWWIEDPAIQFRIGGKAYVIPPSTSETEAQIKDTLKAMGAKGEEADPKWWEEKREQLWKEKMSGHLRASFARPTPGQSLKTVDRQPEEWAESIPAESVSHCRPKITANTLRRIATAKKQRQSSTPNRTFQSSLSPPSKSTFSNSSHHLTSAQASLVKVTANGQRKRSHPDEQHETLRCIRYETVCSTIAICGTRLRLLCSPAKGPSVTLFVIASQSTACPRQ